MLIDVKVKQVILVALNPYETALRATYLANKIRRRYYSNTYFSDYFYPQKSAYFLVFISQIHFSSSAVRNHALLVCISACRLWFSSLDTTTFLLSRWNVFVDARIFVPSYATSSLVPA